MQSDTPTDATITSGLHELDRFLNVEIEVLAGHKLLKKKEEKEGSTLTSTEHRISTIEKSLIVHLSILDDLVKKFSETPNYNLILSMCVKVATSLVDKLPAQIDSENTQESKNATETLNALKTNIEMQPISSRSQEVKNHLTNTLNALHAKEQTEKDAKDAKEQAEKEAFLKIKSTEVNTVLTEVLINNINFWHQQVSFFKRIPGFFNPKLRTAPTGIGKMLMIPNASPDSMDSLIDKLTRMQHIATQQLNINSTTRSEYTKQFYEIFRDLGDIRTLCNDPKKLDQLIETLNDYDFRTKTFHEEQTQYIQMKKM